MPIISSFFGIYIRMYFADHAPAHIHVEYQGHEALLAIAGGALVRWCKAGCRGARSRWSVSGASTIAPSWSRIGPKRRPCSR